MNLQENTYSGGKEIPLAQYGALISLFWILFGGAAIAFTSKQERTSRPRAFGDILLLGVATHMLSRIAAKDRVTSVLRSPFARYVEDGAPGEVEEEPRGTGIRKAVGELVTCPYCMSPWIAAILSIGMSVAPELTRRICSLFSSVAVAYFLHQAYGIADNSREKADHQG